jgi:xylan 1,4-beta-xylosidase
MSRYPNFAQLPAIIDECDAGVPAHFSVYDNSNFRFQNTEYYPVFQVKLMKKLLDLSDLENANIQQATSWSFYFEGERFFEGTRAFLTADRIEKPLLNAYRLLGKLGSQRIMAVSDAAHGVELLDQAEGRSMPEEVDALATRSERGELAIAVWRHSDDQHQISGTDTPVRVSLRGLEPSRYRVTQVRIDAHHSNAHTIWEELGSPQVPTVEEKALIHAREGLETYAPPMVFEVQADGCLELTTALPLPAVSLFQVEAIK